MTGSSSTATLTTRDLEVLHVIGFGGGTAASPPILETLTPAQEIAGMYAGYFDRLPDPTGFAYWEGQYTTALAGGQSTDQALTNIANSFAPQPETLALYPILSSPLNPNSPTEVTGVDNLIVSVYTNLFDRTPAVTDSGVQYWAGQILSGAVPLGQAILDIANGALGADATTFLNKVAVSNYFISKSTVALPSSVEHSVLATVTSDASTVTTAENTISAAVSALTTVPSLAEYFDASQAVYNDNALGSAKDAAPPASTGLMLLVDSRDVNSSWEADGFFAQAFKDTSGHVIIGFEGSIINPTDPNFDTTYGIGSRAADLFILAGLSPRAFSDASNFVSDVESVSGNQPIYLTGHSFGGSEAMYVASHDPPNNVMGGVTFGAPGTLQSASSQSSNFIDYVDYGDPIGNFGNHFGVVQHVGSTANAAVLTAAQIAALETGGVSLVGIAGIYHPLDHYASDLGLQLTSGFA